MSLKDEAKDIFAKTIEQVPNLIIFLGCISFGSSYISYDATGFHFPTANPKIPFIIFGVGLIVVGILIHIVLREKKTKKLKDETVLKFNSTTLTIKIASIQDADNLNNNCAFILPANTTFVDDCVTDTKSALGAFFSKYHQDKIPEFNEALKQILSSKHILPVNGIYYEPSTVLILPEEYSIQAKVILVASAEKSPDRGFQTDPSLISNSIRNVFSETADKRINTFFFPVIGSGHAGMEITEALNLLILCIKFHSKTFHHPKNVFIFVRDTDSRKINASFLNSF